MKNLDLEKQGDVMNPLIKLSDILEHNPCGRHRKKGEPPEGWLKLLDGLNFTAENYDPNFEISLGDIAVINGATDALWCVRVLSWNNITVHCAAIGDILVPIIKRTSNEREQQRTDIIAAFPPVVWKKQGKQ